MFSWWTKKSNGKQTVSSHHRVITLEDARNENFTAWSDPEVAWKQDNAYRGMIEEMYGGNVRHDLTVAAGVLQETGLTDPSVLELGCGSGYYYEVLTHLLNRDLLYVGVDKSNSMILLAKKNYPGKPFLLADATKLPFCDRSFDIVFNGVSLMHILNYAEAISESSRVARSFCIFHTVPVLQKRPTTFLQKSAYGGRVLEIIFNEAELTDLFRRNYLKVRSSLESIPYNLESTLHEKTVTKTYLCEVLPR